MVRTTFIWITGLLGFGIFGILWQQPWTTYHHIENEVAGLIGGMCLFTCMRLWITK